MRFDRHEVELSLKSIHSLAPDEMRLKKMLTLIDLTSLNDSDTKSTIAELCQKAVTPYGKVAAVCVYPQFVKQAAKALAHQAIHVATVANFPYGKDSVEHTLNSIRASIAEGAQEIDVVFPYARYLSGDRETTRFFVKECKKACGPHILLKVILETGALQELPVIDEVAYEVILAGADFIKTSTGKLGIGATLEASAVILLTIKKMIDKFKCHVGFKAAGGIRSIEQALQYVELAEYIMGKDWVNSTNFRLGTSQLVDMVLKELQ